VINKNLGDTNLLVFKKNKMDFSKINIEKLTFNYLYKNYNQFPTLAAIHLVPLPSHIRQNKVLLDNLCRMLPNLVSVYGFSKINCLLNEKTFEETHQDHHQEEFEEEESDGSATAAAAGESAASADSVHLDQVGSSSSEKKRRSLSNKNKLRRHGPLLRYIL
jgi:hypothetical protein